MSFVTLIDGRQVESDSPEWRAECLARHQHTQNVLSMQGHANRGKRAAYVEQVEFSEGAEAARRLSERVKAEWSQGGAR